MARNIYPNQNPSTPAKAIYVNDYGTWRAARGIWVNQSGSWTQVWPARNAWSVSGAELAGSFTPVNIYPTGLDFSPTGNKVFLIFSNGSFNYVGSYDLGTAWDITTAVNLDFGGIGNTSGRTNPGSLKMRPDGTRIFVRFDAGLNYRYNLGTAFNVSTIGTTQSKTFTPVGSDTFFSSDGVHLYCISTSGGSITLTDHPTSGSAWDLAAYYGAATATKTLTGDGSFATIKPDGTKIYTVSTSGYVRTYNLSTAYDITTASEDTFGVFNTGVSATAIRLNDTGTRMFISSAAGNAVYQYNLV